MNSEERFMLPSEPLFPTPAIHARETDPEGLVPLNAAWKALVVAVWLWSLFETRWELAGETRMMAVMATLSAKLVLTVIVFGALRRNHVSLVLFSFCCTVSIIVIAMALPRMYAIAPFYFFLCLIETVLKTASVVALAFDYFGRDTVVDESLPLPTRFRPGVASATSEFGEFGNATRFRESFETDEMRR
ncbi:hypothetical protein [Paraburkholderia acidisoli]|uniref:Uncharacterized protein n=1 Tax=Paraburkholderia acidisoli TaxID=2571748 RepID=A0A7Z2GJY0_9BURK|nr:hypothetical protein [Paraburkholderia acidisoli]QGZ63103.1 hypothetical protein FAZ98_14880 [Paraburkholderia acidisoli]